MRIVVLGAGFGGLELTTTLSREFGDTAAIVLIDREDGFIFGFSKLDVMFGRATEEGAVRASQRGIRWTACCRRAARPSRSFR